MWTLRKLWRRLGLIDCLYTPGPPTDVVGFRGLDSSTILILKGWNSHVHSEFTGKFESSNVSLCALSVVYVLLCYVMAVWLGSLV